MVVLLLSTLRGLSYKLGVESWQARDQAAYPQSAPYCARALFFYIKLTMLTSTIIWMTVEYTLRGSIVTDFNITTSSKVCSLYHKNAHSHGKYVLPFSRNRAAATTRSLDEVSYFDGKQRLSKLMRKLNRSQPFPSIQKATRVQKIRRQETWSPTTLRCRKSRYHFLNNGECSNDF